MYAINFYSPLYEHMLVKGRKTATIRLGDKSDKYHTSQLVWITLGPRFSPRRKLFAAIIDAVIVKPLSEVTPREIDRENPEIRTHEEVAELLSRIYDRPVAMTDTVTVVHFSRVHEEAERRI
ncbi:MAG: ASCH domain-containing protein [Armatimonadetes bacterium]|nr:ASCH domain-containing protein [Armatimonadota bacterium]